MASKPRRQGPGGRRISLALAPYVPRLALEWAATAPEQTWREVDGSLVFVDISGFTALSERLARRGRQGAEELTGTLSTCFADLLTAAYGAGGSLLKFGGDALLLLFDGPDHAMRAATSALRMRSALAHAGRVVTSVGAIRLRMSVGVHSDKVHLFRVGGSHRELLVTGPAATTTVDMEGTAQAGQVVVSPLTAAQIDPTLIGAAIGPGFLLRDRRGSFADTADFPPVPPPTVDVGVAIPVALRDHLTRKVEPEHRQVTVAFVHFDGIDGVINGEGVVAASAALHALTCEVQAAADEEGITFLGSDVDRDGGKIILVAGAPRAQGDDEGRMLRTLRHIADRPRLLPTRFGVNRGHVFVGEVGPPYRRTYTVMGDTVNLAARLMAQARPGQILATAGVLDNASIEFESEPLPPFLVKGKSKPVEAFALGAPSGRRTSARAEESPLVGRDEELASLLDALGSARGDRGGLVDVCGDAGIGKSRLVAEMKRQADGVTMITAFCETYQAKTPYFALRYLLRGAFGLPPDAEDGAVALRRLVTDTAPHLLPWLPLIAAVVDVDATATKEVDALEPQFRRERTRRAVVELLEHALRSPHLFLIEDGQWVDTVSAELLGDLAEAAKSHPWLFCLVRRNDADSYCPDDSITTTRLVLRPLDEAASRAIVAAATKEALLRPHERDAIVRQAGGNPLFLEQLLNATASREVGDLLPDSLEALVAIQIDRLAPEDRTLLRYAAVLGPIFETKLLTELVAGEVKRSPLAALRRLQDFLEPAGSGWLRFRNQCYRQVAYGTLSYGRRRELHARAGAAIEAAQREGGPREAGSERAEILSFHFLHAQKYDRCWDYALAAALNAREKYANVEAAELYDRALLAGSHLGESARDDVAEVWELLGDACLKAGIFDRAKAAYARARRLRAGDTASLARLFRQEALIAMQQGQNANVVRWVKRGLRLLEGREDADEVATRSTLQLLLGEHLQRAGKNREAIPWCELAMNDAIAADDRAALAKAYTVRDLASLGLGLADEATHLRLALEIWEELDGLAGQATVLTILGAVAYWRGRWDDALELFVQGREASTRAGDLINAGYGTCNIADILIDQGRGDEAVVGLHEVLDLWRSVHHPGPVAGALLNLGRCALQRGDYGEALDLFEQAKRSSAAVSEAASVEADAWLAECLIHNGEAVDALPLIDAALRRETAGGGSTFLAKLHRVRGYALGALGRVEQALTEFDRSLEVARNRESLYDEALTLEAIAAVKQSAGQPADPSDDARGRDLLTRLGVNATFAPRIAVAAGS